MWRSRRIDNGEQLPGFHNDGEYSEHAFEAWLRDAAIMPAPVLLIATCLAVVLRQYLFVFFPPGKAAARRPCTKAAHGDNYMSFEVGLMLSQAPGINNTRIVDSNAGSSPADAEAAQAQVCAQI